MENLNLALVACGACQRLEQLTDRSWVRYKRQRSEITQPMLSQGHTSDSTVNESSGCSYRTNMVILYKCDWHKVGQRLLDAELYRQFVQSVCICGKSAENGLQRAKTTNKRLCMRKKWLKKTFERLAWHVSSAADHFFRLKCFIEPSLVRRNGVCRCRRLEIIPIWTWNVTGSQTRWVATRQLSGFSTIESSLITATKQRSIGRYAKFF